VGEPARDAAAGAAAPGRGLFVTGTDTGVGKTVLAGAIAAALAGRGEAVTVLKPVITGLDTPPDPDWPPDHELLARAAGCAPGAVTRLTFGPAVSPHLAAELAGAPIDARALVDSLQAATTTAGAARAVVEGVGGLLVPLGDGFDVRDLAVALGLPLVIAARPGLGTINHTLLTLAAARQAGLVVAAVVLTPWPERPSMVERSNLATIERRGTVEVATLPPLPRAEPELLRRAGEQLPLDRWFATVSSP